MEKIMSLLKKLPLWTLHLIPVSRLLLRLMELFQLDKKKKMEKEKKKKLHGILVSRSDLRKTMEKTKKTMVKKNKQIGTPDSKSDPKRKKETTKMLKQTEQQLT